MTTDRISPEYLNELMFMHKRKRNWGTSAGRWAGEVAALAHNLKATSVLDYGAGKCVLRDAMQRYAVTAHLDWREYDPAILEIAAEPSMADVVACLDVLEHVEASKINAVVAHIASLTARAALIVVNTREARATLLDGRNAHILVRDADWWRALFAASGLHEVRSRTTHKELIYVGARLENAT